MSELPPGRELDAHIHDQFFADLPGTKAQRQENANGEADYFYHLPIASGQRLPVNYSGKRKRVPDYSTQVDDAYLIWQKIEEMGGSVEPQPFKAAHGAHAWRVTVQLQGKTATREGEASLRALYALALCRAALAAVEG